MATWNYKGMDTSGNEVAGSVEANSEDDAQAQIRAKGHFVYDLKEQRSWWQRFRGQQPQQPTPQTSVPNPAPNPPSPTTTTSGAGQQPPRPPIQAPPAAPEPERNPNNQPNPAAPGTTRLGDPFAEYAANIERPPSEWPEAVAARRRQEEEAERSLPNMVGELQRRQEAQLAHYRGGGGLRDIPGQALASRTVEQERRVERTYGAANPQEQQAVARQLELVNQNTKLLDEEINKRRIVNKELTASQYALINFHQAMAQGDIKGAMSNLISSSLGAATPAGLIGQLALTVGTRIAESVKREMEERRAEAVKGASIVSPSLQQTQQRSAELAAAREAIRTGEVQRLREQAYLDQLRAEARRVGAGPTSDPTSWFAQGAAFRTYFAGERAYEQSLFRGEHRGGAEAARARVYQEHYREEIRRRGGVVPERMREDIVIPGVSAGILGGGSSSGARAYQEELQVGGLHREDATNALLQEQLQQLYDLKEALEGIRANTSNMPSFNPWGT